MKNYCHVKELNYSRKVVLNFGRCIFSWITVYLIDTEVVLNGMGGPQGFFPSGKGQKFAKNSRLSRLRILWRVDPLLSSDSVNSGRC
jgi:hypothetical protein